MRAERVLFVTGADTGVGKTFVAAALLRHLAERGWDVVGVKPVETGCGGAIRPEEDGAILAAASGQTSPRAALTRLGLPVAPPVAAEAEGVRLTMETWIEAIDPLTERHDLVLVEGAGGLLSPLTWSTNLRDMLVTIRSRALVVASDRLGTLNHTLLTLEALGRSALGVVFTAPEKADESTGTNRDALARVRPDVNLISIGRYPSWEAATEEAGGIAPWIEER